MDSSEEDLAMLKSYNVSAYNHSSSEDEQYIDVNLYEKYHYNRAVSEKVYYTLIAAYSVLIFFGSVGNLFVIIAVISNKSKLHSFWQIRKILGKCYVGKYLIG